MNVLLTGATGFLGSHLLRKLDDKGFQVLCLKRSFSNLSRIQDIVHSKNIQFFDVDKNNLSGAFSQNKFTAIIHVATEYGRQETPISSILDTNVIFPLRLIELGITHGVQGFINTDSYFNKESFSYSRLINYSLSKKSLLSWLRFLAKDIKIINLSLEHIYGPQDGVSKFTESIIQQIAVAQVPRVPMTHGHQKRDFIYVDDVTDAYLVALKYLQTGDFHFRTFEVGTGQSLPVRTFAELVKKHSNSSSELGFGDIEYRSDEIMDSKADNLPLIDLGWQPKYTPEAGICSVLKAYGVIG